MFFYENRYFLVSWIFFRNFDANYCKFPSIFCIYCYEIFQIFRIFFDQKFRFLTKIDVRLKFISDLKYQTKIADQNFRPNFRPTFQTKISYQKFDFRPKFQTKISIFDQNFDFRSKFRFSTKISIFDQNFYF